MQYFQGVTHPNVLARVDQERAIAERIGPTTEWVPVASLLGIVADGNNLDWREITAHEAAALELELRRR